MLAIFNLIFSALCNSEIASFLPIELLAQVLRKTACRVSEGIQLRYQNVTKDSIFFPKAITKAKLKSRFVPINEEFYNQIMQFKADNELLKGETFKPDCYLLEDSELIHI